MARIPVEKESSGAAWWTWILGLLLILLVLWLLWSWIDGDEPEPIGETGIEEVEPAVPANTEPGLVISDILSNPDEYVGQSFPDTEVTVASVPTDRGFWIVQRDDSLFSLIIDVPEEEQKDINPEATLRITDGALRDQTYLPDLPGRPIDQATETIVREQDIFLVVDERNISILEQGSPQEGTDPAQTMQ